MTYGPRPNASGDTLSASRDQIRENFELIQTQFEQNHVSIQNDGKHKFLQLPEQSAAPTTAADEGGLYTKLQDGTTELFYRRESDGSELQMTPILPIRAAANFDGTVAGNNAVQTLRSSFNISSITRSGTSTGTYVVSFDSNLPNRNYIVLLTGQFASNSNAVIGKVLQGTYNDIVKVSSVTIRFSDNNNTLRDVQMGNIVILGG